MFPESNIDTEKTTDVELKEPGISFLYDFETGDFVLKDGRLVQIDGIEALKIWIEKLLRTEKYKFDIYKDSDYGIRTEDLIGMTLPKSFIESELKREIKEAVEKHSMIESVSNINTTRDGSKLTINYTINLTTGETLNEEVVQ